MSLLTKGWMVSKVYLSFKQHSLTIFCRSYSSSGFDLRRGHQAAQAGGGFTIVMTRDNRHGRAQCGAQVLVKTGSSTGGTA